MLNTAGKNIHTENLKNAQLRPQKPGSRIRFYCGTVIAI